LRGSNNPHKTGMDDSATMLCFEDEDEEDDEDFAALDFVLLFCD